LKHITRVILKMIETDNTQQVTAQNARIYTHKRHTVVDSDDDNDDSDDITGCEAGERRR